MDTKPTVTGQDNGYFEIWTLPCGHTVRVDTEYEQWNRRTKAGYRAASQTRTRDRLAAKPCRTCTDHDAREAEIWAQFEAGQIAEDEAENQLAAIGR